MVVKKRNKDEGRRHGRSRAPFIVFVLLSFQRVPGLLVSSSFSVLKITRKND